MLSLDYGVELGGQARAVATVNFVCFWLRSSCRQILRRYLAKYAESCQEVRALRHQRLNSFMAILAGIG